MATKAKKKTSKKTSKKTAPKKEGGSKKSKLDFPNVHTASRTAPPKPATLRVCGNTIPVRKGKAGEADPKVLKARRIEGNRRRKLGFDEERI